MQSRELNRFRRYQHMMMYGGAATATAVVIAAFVINAISTVSAYTARESELLSLDVRPVIDFTVRAEATLRSNVQSLELAWNAGGAAPPDTVARFSRDRNLLRVQQTPDVLPILVAGASPSNPPAPAAGRFIRLSETMAGPSTVIAARNGGELTAYLYSTDRSLMLLTASPWPSDVRWATLLANRSMLFDALAGPQGKPLLPADAPLRKPGTTWPAVHWLPAYDSPLAGQRRVRVAAAMLDSQRKPFGVVVVERSVEALTASLDAASLNGSLLLLARDGTVIASRSRHPVDNRTIAAAREALADGIGTARQRANTTDYRLAGWQIGDTGWTLVHVESWLGVATELRGPLLTSLATTSAIIAAIWILLLLFDRRVYRPVLARSQRVFESEQLNRTLIETAPVGLGLISMTNGAPLAHSPTMIETARRVVVPARTLSAELAERYRKHRQSGAAGGITHEELTLPTHDGGSLDLAVSVAPARYQGEDVLVTAFTDVTARKRLEQQLREAREAADAANAAKSAFLATMSHEIRTPLNAILGNLELLSQSRLDALQSDRLRTIRASSDGLLGIISDVLDFSKIEAGEMTLEYIGFDALEVASRSLTMFAPVARAKNLRLSACFGVTTTRPMRGDPMRLGQVINNLLSNAVKFTEHGEVMLRVSAADEAALLIEVEDSGIGMSAQQQAALFQPFSQADATISRRFGGTGLGLALCARLALAMGGEVGVRSEPGKGSCFTVRVPLGEPAIAPAMPRFAGETVAFVAAADAWHAYAVPALRAWGLTVNAYRHPAQIDEVMLDELEAVILCGERDTWHADDEARLMEDASWVIDCGADGPGSPVATSRLVRVSSFSLMGLASALQYTLRGVALEQAGETTHVLPRRLKVLVAEDNAANRRLFEEQLEALGCESVTAEDGEQALECLMQQTFDVLVTDLSMPGLDGYALASETRARWPAMPVVAATAASTPQERERCETVGIARVVSKPLSLARLRAVLSEVAGLPAVAAGVDIAQTDGAREDDAGVVDVLGGRALSDDLRHAFLASFGESLAAIAVAQRSDDAARVLAELHSLQGALGVFGAVAQARQCAHLEGLVRDGGVAAAADLLDAFDIQVQATILRHVSIPDEALSLILAIVERALPDRATRRLLHIVRVARGETTPIEPEEARAAT
ncbi:UNVERIFIED_ORG: two-component system capsular synthesis sensor histidine kinase RcsC [Burkholderia sp. 1263]